jgi:hypothetical protein
LVGEKGPEFYTPYANGTITNAVDTAQVIGSGPVVSGATVNLEQHIHGLPMQARTPVEVGYETRRAIRMGVPLAPPKRRRWG